ncbi:alcohol dehydrogenase catalytic domain-containing protein [Clostridioides difficile]|nr:alcohol dehydrogenase catalytic domain-containing protein [Clostridioides difficile]
MINSVYRLISPKQIVVFLEDIKLKENELIVRPTKLSICAADQRYYTGMRGKEALEKKLPMALIHEAVGEIVFDPKNEFKVGEKVAMIPNTPMVKDNVICENYIKDSKFRSSGYDGFMQEYVFMRRDRVILYNNIDEDIASFIELVSVSMHSIERFEKNSNINKDIIGVWGDGSVGFITSLILKIKYPKSKIVVFGKHEEKLGFFSFVDEVYLIDMIPKHLNIDHAFEAVGGLGSGKAINQIIKFLNPEGTINILGVSEIPIEINTRMILEKGISLIGSSRSGRKDFESTISFLEKNISMQNQLRKLISNIIIAKSIGDINNAFEYDLSTSFKTIIDWKI